MYMYYKVPNRQYCVIVVHHMYISSAESQKGINTVL